MKLTRSLLSMLLFSFLHAFPHVSGQGILTQEVQEELEITKADSLAKLPFSIVGITRELGATEKLLVGSEALDLSEENLEDYTADVDSLFTQIELFRSDTSLFSLEDLSFRELNQIGQQIQFYMDQINEQVSRYSGIVIELENQMLQLHVKRQRWLLTLEQGQADAALEARKQRIQGTLQRVDEVRLGLQEDLVVLFGRNTAAHRNTDFHL